MGMLIQTAEPAKEVLGVETIDVVADKGYFKIEDIESCKKAGMAPYVPRPQRGPSFRAGLFRKDEFRYDANGASRVSLTALAYNLRRVLNIVGFAELMAAVAA